MRSAAITRNVLLLGLVSCLTDVSSDMIIPLLPLFLTQTLKVDIRWLGYMEGFAETTASVFKLLSGWYSDRIGRRKPIVVIGYTLSTIGRPLMAIATAGWHIVLVRLFDRIGKGLRGAPRDALIAETTPKQLLGRAFGFHRALDNAGGVAGPLVASGILLLAPGDYRLVFWCALIPGLVTIPLLLAIREPAQIQPTQDRPKIRLSLKPFSPSFKRYLAIVLLFTLSNSSDLFLVALAKDRGMADAAVPIFWLALQLAKLLMAYPGGMLADRVGRQRLLVAGWLLYAAAYLGFALSSREWHMWALLPVYGMFYGCTEASERVIVSELVPKKLKATAYGLFSFSVGVTLLPASVVMGWLYSADWAGPRLAFGVSALLAAVAALLLAQKPLQRAADDSDS